MDAEALKIILDLKEENVLLKRQVTTASIILSKRERLFSLESGIEEISLLFREIYDILEDFEKIQQPTNQADSTNYNIQ